MYSYEYACIVLAISQIVRRIDSNPLQLAEFAFFPSFHNVVSHPIRVACFLVIVFVSCTHSALC